jgi:glucosylglycerol-phosphate synthase
MTRARFAIVYHRAPDGDGAVGASGGGPAGGSPNGIIPTLRAVFAPDRPGLWIAWEPAHDARREAGRDVVVDHGHGLAVHRIALAASVVETFYYRFSKEALWPVICSSPGNIRFDEAQWDVFVDVNRRFAVTVQRLVEPGATVWVHDYNLWLVPGLLRERLPSARIGFFHHTPFPAPDIFAILPWREQIVRSLLACDLVGFHLPHYANNFAAAAEGLVGAEETGRTKVGKRFLTAGTALSTPTMATKLELDGRPTRLGAFPAAIDSARIDSLRATRAHGSRVEAIRRELDGQQILLSVERLDYVKGTVEKLLAYERLLESHPRYRGVVAFVNVVAPAADGMSVHRAVGETIDTMVGRINGRFSTLSWTPVRYFHQPLSFERVVSWYEAATIAWIAPLRDGLNLVAKEFVAASDGASKVLVLSEFAGAHVELEHAVAVNPYSPRSMDEALLAALEMPAGERRSRMVKMGRIVRGRTPRRWADEVLAVLSPEGCVDVTRTPRARLSIDARRAPSDSS